MIKGKPLTLEGHAALLHARGLYYLLLRLFAGSFSCRYFCTSIHIGSNKAVETAENIKILKRGKE